MAVGWQLDGRQAGKAGCTQLPVMIGSRRRTVVTDHHPAARWPATWPYSTGRAGQPLPGSCTVRGQSTCIQVLLAHTKDPGRESMYIPKRHVAGVVGAGSWQVTASCHSFLSVTQTYTESMFSCLCKVKRIAVPIRHVSRLSCGSRHSPSSGPTPRKDHDKTGNLRKEAARQTSVLARGCKDTSREARQKKAITYGVDGGSSCERGSESSTRNRMIQRPHGSKSGNVRGRRYDRKGFEGRGVAAQSDGQIGDICPAVRAAARGARDREGRGGRGVRRAEAGSRAGREAL